MTEERPSWESYFEQIAKITATRSPCQRLKVGAIIVKNKRVISQGYNGYLPGCPHNQYMRDGHELATAHAEQNAIANCAACGVSCNDSTMYITHYPCIHCVKLIIASGIKEINYIDDYRNDSFVEEIANMAQIKINKLDNSI